MTNAARITTALKNVRRARTEGVKKMADITRLLASTLSDTDARQELMDALENGITLSPEMTEQARVWMLDLQTTPGGKPRKYAPFGSREMHILENLGHIEWTDAYKLPHNVNSVPVFTVYDRDGNGFEYRMDYTRPEKIAITG